MRVAKAYEQYASALRAFRKATAVTDHVLEVLNAAWHRYQVAQRMDRGEFPHLHPHFGGPRHKGPMPRFHHHHMPGPHMHVHPMPIQPVGPPPPVMVKPMGPMVKPLPPMGPPPAPGQPIVVRPLPHHIVHHHVHGGHHHMPPRGPMHPQGPHMVPMRRQNANTIVQGEFVIKPTIVIPDNFDLAPIENWFEKQFPNFPALDIDPKFPPVEHFSFPEGLLPPPPPLEPLVQPDQPLTPVLIPIPVDDQQPAVFF